MLRLVVTALILAACSHSVPPNVAAIPIGDDAPAGECKELGPITGTHSGNDRELILANAKDDLRASAHKLGGNYVKLDKMDERGVSLGFQGMGGVGPEITFSGHAYACPKRATAQ